MVNGKMLVGLGPTGFHAYGTQLRFLKNAEAAARRACRRCVDLARRVVRGAEGTWGRCDVGAGDGASTQGARGGACDVKKSARGGADGVKKGARGVVEEYKS